jgi:hypothetical protein
MTVDTAWLFVSWYHSKGVGAAGPGNRTKVSWFHCHAVKNPTESTVSHRLAFLFGDPWGGKPHEIWVFSITETDKIRRQVQSEASSCSCFLTKATATTDGSIAKCFASDAAVQHTTNAARIIGGSGHIRGFEVERLHRDAKITQIHAGTNQIQRAIIAREPLKA